MTTMIQRTGGRNQDYFIIIRYTKYYPWSGIMWYENELMLVVNVYSKSRATTKKYKKKYNWYAKKIEKMESYEMLKWNYKRQE